MGVGVFYHSRPYPLGADKEATGKRTPHSAFVGLLASDIQTQMDPEELSDRLASEPQTNDASDYPGDLESKDVSCGIQKIGEEDTETVEVQFCASGVHEAEA